MLENTFVLLVIGFLLGAPAGFSPGPMLVLIISETLRHGIRTGAKVAFIPIISDLPLLLFTGFFYKNLTKIDTLVGSISIAGSFFLIYIGVRSFRTKILKDQDYHPRKLSIKELIILNFFNPNPYLFWFTVGSPLMVRSFEKSLISGFFYFWLLFWTSRFKIFTGINYWEIKNFHRR
tara:strand:- start:1533 stop:2063 length:531 start_codon:yes stop_codon:yes gene_type:complete